MSKILKHEFLSSWHWNIDDIFPYLYQSLYGYYNAFDPVED